MFVTARESRLYDCVDSKTPGEKLCFGPQCLAWRWRKGVASSDILDSPAWEKQHGYCGKAGVPASDAKMPPR
jgi:hypothetical protein